MKAYIRLSAIITACMLPLAPHAETWTLDSCISYALSHNISVRLSEVSAEQARQSVTQARSGYLPTVSASAGQSWNLGRGLTSSNTYANRSTSSFNWGVSGSLPLFDGLRTPRGIAYAKANLSQIVERYKAAKEDVSINVITAYLQALYTKALLEVSQRQTALSEDELTRRQALLEAGKIPEVDMLEAKSQLANDQLNEVQAANNHTMALVDLAKLLRLEGTAGDIEVAPLADDGSLIPKPDEAYDLARRYSHNIEAARQGIEASEANIKLSQSGYLPTLSFGTSIGSTYYRISGMPNESFGQQMRHNYSTYFGFQLNVPIFDALGTRNSVRQAKVEKIQSELQLQQAEDDLYRTINDAYQQAIGAYKKYESSLVAEEYAAKAFEAMREKYNLGRATATEYGQSNAKALQATAERIQANCELILRSRILNYYTTPH